MKDNVIIKVLIAYDQLMVAEGLVAILSEHPDIKVLGSLENSENINDHVSKLVPDIIIFEGWCVGSKHQSQKKLKKPINTLEKNYDKNLIWRKKVNNELKNNYKKTFKFIDKLIFLEVPSFEYVFKWRLLQEKKLKVFSKGKKIMNNTEINKFIMYYERITRQMLKDLKYNSDIVIKVDKKHRLNSIRFN